MSEDGVRADRESQPVSFDFDEEAISSLLDTFIATQTGAQKKRVSRPPDPSDTGAQAAQRTVFQHTPRHEALPLVGDDDQTKQRRIELLETLAEGSVGSARARLLTSAGELHEQLGEYKAALSCYGRALDADARDVVVLRALRRLAMQRDGWRAAAETLEREAALDLSTTERASALQLLAGLHLTKLGDPAAAEQAATHAATLREDDFVPRLLIASARMARGDTARAADALIAAAERWPDARGQSVILMHAATLFEEVDAPERAQPIYARVLELQPDFVAAHLGAIRIARALDDTDAAVEASNAAAGHAPAPVADALRRALVGSLEPSRRGAAVAGLRGSEDAASIWTLAEVAAFEGNAETVIDALRAGSVGLTPKARAVSAARQARLQAEQGNESAFAEAVRDAAAEPKLDAYLQAATRVGFEDVEEGSDVRRLLQTISNEASGAASDMVRADDAAREADGSAFLESLKRELDRAPIELQAGAALATAEIGALAGLVDRQAAHLEIEERLAQDLLVARASLFEDADRERNAQRWIREGESTNGDRSAFAFTMAARLASSDESAANACNAALERAADYWPALWILEDQSGSPDARAASAAAQANLAPREAASCWVRASIWAPSAEEWRARAASAFDREAPDPLLLEHLFAATRGTPEQAGDLMAMAARNLDLLAYSRRAAACYREAGLQDRASKILREASAEDPSDLAVEVERKAAELGASEFARLADSAMRRARAAVDDAERLAAFAAMAEVDRLAKRDMQSARLSLQSIAEMRPAHVPTARALEWDALREHDTERIRSSARRMLEALSAKDADHVARQRLVLELLAADDDIMQAEIDRLLLSLSDALESDPGLARKVLGAAYAADEPRIGLRALVAAESYLDEGVERGALALDKARLLQRLGEPQHAVTELDTAHAHPLAREGQARLIQSDGRWEDAAAAYLDAASQAKNAQRAASLCREAACIFEERLEDDDRAADAWMAAAEADLTYQDVYRRLAALHRRREDLVALTALTEARIAAGADTPTLVGLLLDKARQHQERGDAEGVIATLDECLELDPHHFVALRELVEARRATEDWQGAAEALIRIARLDRDTDEKVWAFSRLAEIYDAHMDDLPRAEAALRQVLRYAPNHVEPLDRLASALSRQGKVHEAAALLEQLVHRAAGDAQARDYRIRLAGAHESAGDRRRAESILESLRAEQSTEPDVILALADFHERQGDTPAEAMHLNRAVVDLRDAIDGAPGSEALWTTLVRVLGRRHGPGPASCAASAAIAIGHPASLFEGEVTPLGEALGEPALPLSTDVDDIVAPRAIPRTVRRLFALCEHAFDKALPFDAAAWGLRRPSGPERALVEEAGSIAEMLGVSEPRLKVTNVAPAACMPITGDPPTLVIGARLQELTSPRERAFLFARALKVAGSHLAPALRGRTEDLDAALLALLQGHETSRLQHTESQRLVDLRKRLLKSVPRKSRDEVESLVLELRGDPTFSTRAVPLAISELGDRVALTLTGDVPAAAGAILKVAGRQPPDRDDGLLIVIRETPEAWSIIRFASSDAHFEARTQAGVDP